MNKNDFKINFLLRFYEQRKYVNKIEERWTHGCTTKQLGLLTKSRDMEKNCFTCD